MKKIIAFVMAMVMCLMLFACSQVPVDTTDDDEKKAESETKVAEYKVAEYSEKDFLFYDENGKVIERLLDTKTNIGLSETEGGMTYRKVAIGDDAISALEKYDLCYGKSAYSIGDEDAVRLTKKSDIKSAILTGDEVYIMICLDENYEAVDLMAILEKQLMQVESKNPTTYLLFGFMIKEGKVVDVRIGKQRY